MSEMKRYVPVVVMGGTLPTVSVCEDGWLIHAVDHERIVADLRAEVELLSDLAVDHERIVAGLRSEVERLRDLAGAMHSATHAAGMAADEREAFEAKFPMPRNCIRVGNSYAATEFNAWQAQAYGEIRKGWIAALEWRESSAPSAPTPPAQQPVAWVLFHNGEVAYDRDELIICNLPGDRLDESYEWRRVYAAPPAQQSLAAIDVLAERRRQIESEDFDSSHDDMATRGQLAGAAACYALNGVEHWARDQAIKTFWPWDESWWKPGDRRRSLVKAGALIIAEIERLDRAAAPGDTAAPEQQGQWVRVTPELIQHAQELQDSWCADVQEGGIDGTLPLPHWILDVLSSAGDTAAPEQAEQTECGCCGQAGPCDQDCDCAEQAAVKVPRELLSRITRNGGVDTLLAIDELRAMLGGGE